jgi:hypothetical protein
MEWSSLPYDANPCTHRSDLPKDDRLPKCAALTAPREWEGGAAQNSRNRNNAITNFHCRLRNLWDGCKPADADQASRAGDAVIELEGRKARKSSLTGQRDQKSVICALDPTPGVELESFRMALCLAAKDLHRYPSKGV